MTSWLQIFGTIATAVMIPVVASMVRDSSVSFFKVYLYVVGLCTVGFYGLFIRPRGEIDADKCLTFVSDYCVPDLLTIAIGFAIGNSIAFLVWLNARHSNW